MKISEVIARLESIKKEHGDLPCGIQDADTDWKLLLEESRGISYDSMGAVLFYVDLHGPSVFEALDLESC